MGESITDTERVVFWENVAKRNEEEANYYQAELEKAHALLGRVIHQCSERWDTMNLMKWFPTDNLNHKRNVTNPTAKKRKSLTKHKNFATLLLGDGGSMPQDKFIFLDMDGVLVDFTQGIIDYFDLTVTTQAFISWDSVYPLTGFSPAELWAQLGYDFWVNLKFIEEAPAILSMTSEFRPVLLSMPPQLTLSTYMAKAAWIKRNLPNFFYEGRLLLGGTKFQIAGPGKLLIDDSDALVEDWRAYGGSAILVPRPWNKKCGQSVLNTIRHGLNLFSEENYAATY